MAPFGRRKLVLAALAAILLLLIGGRMAAELLVDALWYRSIDAEQVFWLRWGVALGVRAAFGAVVALAVLLNLWFVTRTLGSIRVRRRYANIEIAEQLPRGYVYATLAAVALLSAWWFTAGMSDPLAVLASLRHVQWGVREPVFGHDLAFYVFTLPLLETLQSLLGVLVIWNVLLVGGSYLATGSIRLSQGFPEFTPHARRHLGLLLASFLVVVALDAWLDRYELVIAGNGVGDAFGYTDAHARLPGQLLVTVLAVGAAVLVGLGAWRGRHRWVAGGLAAVILGVAGVDWVYPAAVQKLVVEPNEFPRERAYIQRHLALTQLGYGLRDLDTVALPYRATVPDSAAELRQRVAGIPLWDARPLLTAFGQRQSLFPYYEFVSAHADRYGPAGAAEQVAVSVRELNTSLLPDAAQTWQNLHLAYVSGEGVVVSPASRMSDDGVPLYYLSDLDPPKLSPAAPPALALREPSVFFGERSSGYVLLDEQEPGPRGIALDATWKRLVYAWAFQSRNLFLSGEVAGRRIVYRRQVVDRARALAPFLYIPQEQAAQPVIFNGRVVWLIDGYTASDALPLSRRAVFGGRPVRYIRNSAKVLVDGVTGAVAVYEVEPDPILRTYAALLPGVVRPLSEMPPQLQRHLRYPAPLVALQAELLAEYHMTDARRFYSREDVWAIATENYRGESVAVSPTYATMPLPGSAAPEFLLTIPMVARGRQNLTALLVARNDPPHYGEQLLFQFPRDQQVAGPQQVEAMIDQDPEISQQLSLWRQGGSDVIRGHLIMVPVDSTLVYVEPLYLESENSAIPQLERIIVASANRVVMRPSLEAAVAALVGTETDAPAPAPRETASPAPATGGDGQLARIRELFGEAERQLRSGDWAAFGRTWEAIRGALGSAGSPAVPRP